AQPYVEDTYLGIWRLKDRSNHIDIIKEGDLYYVIEFGAIKHELFFSGDKKRAMFMEWGKGPDVFASMLLFDGIKVTRLYFSPDYIWEPSQYTFYKER
ncbi:MAG: hypothetical protein ACYC5N_11865, partial [Endomicrobiales bacterium]